MYSTKKEEGVEPYKSNVSKIRMVNLSNHWKYDSRKMEKILKW